LKSILFISNISLLENFKYILWYVFYSFFADVFEDKQLNRIIGNSNKFKLIKKITEENEKISIEKVMERGAFSHVSKVRLLDIPMSLVRLLINKKFDIYTDRVHLGISRLELFFGLVRASLILPIRLFSAISHLSRWRFIESKKVVYPINKDNVEDSIESFYRMLEENERPKIMIVHPYLFSKGGAERVTLKVAKRYNAPIYAFLYDPEKTFPEFREMKIVRVGGIVAIKMLSGFKYLRSFLACLSYLTCKIEEDYDVIIAFYVPAEFIRNRNERVLWYCHSPNREIYDLKEYRDKKRNFVQRIISNAVAIPYMYFENRIVPKIERITSSSNVIAERVRKYLNRNATVIYPSLEVGDFHNSNYNKYFFYPSRIIREKRFEYAIDAFKKISRANPGFKMVIAGFVNEKDPYLKELVRISEGFPIEFILNPPDGKIKEMYSNSYSVVFSAINEDFGLIPLEAMASEKPIISVNEGGPRETIIDGKTGFLVNSVEEMAEKMQFLIDNPKTVAKMGRDGRKHVEDNFSDKRFFEQMDEEIKKVA